MRIVVGIDGSDSALEAVRTAAAEAAERGADLRIVHAFIWPLMHIDTRPAPLGPQGGGLRHQSERWLSDAADTARYTAPEIPVETRLITGAAAAVLVEEAAEAQLVVVGDRGLGAISGLLVGSVAVAVAHRAACPVMVVKGPRRASGPVVVGIDGSAASEAALAAALVTAELRKAPLVLAHVAGLDDLVNVPDMAALMRGHSLPVVEEVLVGDSAAAFVRHTTGARIVVVGSRGHGALTGLLLGSFSQYVLHHTRRDVLIVPAVPRTNGEDR
ncbi:universal stress protein [Actinorhabdospora filicis]|nr:universal stress protein [Actinorhabdospora filicis]